MDGEGPTEQVQKYRSINRLPKYGIFQTRISARALADEANAASGTAEASANRDSSQRFRADDETKPQGRNPEFAPRTVLITLGEPFRAGAARALRSPTALDLRPVLLWSLHG